MLTSELYNYFEKSNSVSTDSRSIKKGSIFFALKGDNFDGNKFALKVINKCPIFCGPEKSSKGSLTRPA